MAQVALRTAKDRLCYSVSFEVSLMLILVPAGSLFFSKSIADMGLLGLVLSFKAMLVSLLFNWLFDLIESRRGVVSSDRSLLGRILHALGFEVCLLITSLPIYAWWLGLTVLQAIATDLVVTSLVVVYTYFFALAYDRLFPVLPEHSIAAS